MKNNQKWQDTTILVGNGLGMDLKSERFSLVKALEEAWNCQSLSLSSNFKDFCKAFFPQENRTSQLNRPTNEAELDKMHLFFSALNKIKPMDAIYDDKIAKELFDFSDEYIKLSRHIIIKFFDYELSSQEYEKFNPFFNSLKSLITNGHRNCCRTNIFTTNYDKILYSSLIAENDIFGSSFHKSRIIDGFYLKNNNGHPTFSTSNLWRHKSSHGFYIHLHGNPLFYEDDKGQISKLKLSDSAQYQHLTIESLETEHKIDLSIDHLVLCAPSKKPIQIASSPLLQSYFKMFEYRMNNSNHIILFGYNGIDTHINEAIKIALSKNTNATVHIVEWNNAHETRLAEDSRLAADAAVFWSQKLDVKVSRITYIPKISILSLDFQKEILSNNSKQT